MNKILSNLLQRFNSSANVEQAQQYAKAIRTMSRPPRSATYKPAFSMGYRGARRSMNPLGRIPAPRIDEVRKLERAYLCKLIVKKGLLYFRNTDIAFTNARGKDHRHAVMQEKLGECT